MTITAPPRPPRPSDPVDREELEALVEALFEEARQRARRRRRSTRRPWRLWRWSWSPCRPFSSARHSRTPLPRRSRRGRAFPPERQFQARLHQPQELRLLWPRRPLPALRDERRWEREAAADARVRGEDLPGRPMGGSSPSTASPATGEAEIYVINADGSGKRRLTRNAGCDFGPAWSPDGRKIAFSRGANLHQQVYVMNADGSGQRRLTRLAAHKRVLPGCPTGRSPL